MNRYASYAHLFMQKVSLCKCCRQGFFGNDSYIFMNADMAFTSDAMIDFPDESCKK